MRRRPFLFAALALLVPLPAFALSGESAPNALPRAGELGVSASLDGCGILDNAVVCRIDASFNPVEGATSYAASVTRADGSVVDYGEISGGGAASFWVPYVGDGTYTVQISAYGQIDSDAKPDLVAKDKAAAGDGGQATGNGTGAAGETAADAPADAASADEPAPEPIVDDTDPEPVPPDPATTCDQTALGTAATAEADAAAGAPAEVPEAIDCPPVAEPDPTVDDGTPDPGTVTTPDPDATVVPPPTG